jgi:hypothetical protein
MSEILQCLIFGYLTCQLTIPENYGKVALLLMLRRTAIFFSLEEPGRSRNWKTFLFTI